MSDSVDRVFVHALATVRRLPRTGSSRPPPSSRLRLYGLYKQSMEGDVLSILPRPTLPTSPTTSLSRTDDPRQQPVSTNPNVHRYASRDLRVREAEAEIEKWDSWHACAGMSRTEAKRRYISTLIDTMKEYASGTSESRELVSELEFVWNQIKSQSGSSDEDGNGDGSRERESPTRRLERAGLKQMMSFGSIPPDGRTGGIDPGGRSTSVDPNRLRVLSPVSARSIDDIVEGEEIDPETGALVPSSRSRRIQTPSRSSDPDWRNRIESHLRHLSTEVAALREQLSSHNLLSSSTFSTVHLSRRRRVLFRILGWGRWLAAMVVKQLVIDAVLVAGFVAWARWKGYKDRRVEEWARRRWRDLRMVIGTGNMRVRSLVEDMRIPRLTS